MSDTIELAGEGGGITIAVKSVQRDGDAAQLACEVRVQLAGFAGIEPAAVSHAELEMLRGELRELLEGRLKSVTFSTSEQALELTLSKRDGEVVRIDGIVRHDAEPRFAVTFELQTDVARVHAAEESLGAVVRHHSPLN